MGISDTVIFASVFFLLLALVFIYVITTRDHSGRCRSIKDILPDNPPLAGLSQVPFTADIDWYQKHRLRKFYMVLSSTIAKHDIEADAGVPGEPCIFKAPFNVLDCEKYNGKKCLYFTRIPSLLKVRYDFYYFEEDQKVLIIVN